MDTSQDRSRSGDDDIAARVAALLEQVRVLIGEGRLAEAMPPVDALLSIDDTSLLSASLHLVKGLVAIVEKLLPTAEYDRLEAAPPEGPPHPQTSTPGPAGRPVRDPEQPQRVVRGEGRLPRPQ